MTKTKIMVQICEIRIIVRLQTTRGLSGRKDCIIRRLRSRRGLRGRMSDCEKGEGEGRGSEQGRGNGWGKDGNGM